MKSDKGVYKVITGVVCVTCGNEGAVAKIGILTKQNNIDWLIEESDLIPFTCLKCGAIGSYAPTELNKVIFSIVEDKNEE